jgi:diguanylate cyclase (GGDEF)-like protein
MSVRDINSPPEGALGPGPQPRLLIVDDLPESRELFCRRLQKHGFEAVGCSDGREAIALAASRQYDLVLLDVMMPELSGLDVLRELRAHAETSRLPVIMVTARSDSSDIAEAINLGANDYLTKPIDFVVALARIEAQLDRRRAEEDLRMANLSLEQRVAERTSALAAVNKRLAEEVEERKRSERLLRHLAHHDSLTDLLNRSRFSDELEAEIERAKRSGEFVAVLCLDLDGFKAVNDTHGHPVGDTLLCRVAERIRAVIPDSALAARLGGDEFAVVTRIAPDRLSTSIDLANELVATIQEAVTVGASVLQVGASGGISVFPRDGDSPAALLKAADIALYQAKTDSRNRCKVFSPELTNGKDQRKALIRELKEALAGGQFELHYQPIVDLATRETVCCEALLRWRHPEKGLITPDKFISTAEDSGLILPLGEWVLRQACADAMNWPASVGLTVNLSSLNFEDPGFIETVQDIVERAGFEASRLEIEVTERLPLSSASKVLDDLKRVREMGISLSLDDFGAGSSALSYLLRYPFNKIKIDRTFIGRLGSTEGAVTLVRAMLGVARGLGLATLAEGVETERQASILLEEGCQQAQGFYFGKPYPAQVIRQMLLDHKKNAGGGSAAA